MRHKITSIVMLAMLLCGSLFIGVQSALAYDHTNYAGRADTCSRLQPACGGTYDSSCHWTIYGKVNGSDVLFGPNHCFGNNTVAWGPGQPVYNGAGVRLGFIASAPSMAVNADMTWMWLDTGQKPFDKNEIMVNGGSWSISQKIPNSSLTCANLVNNTPTSPLYDDFFKVSYWTETYGYEGPFYGQQSLSYPSINYGNGRCLIATDTPFDAGSRHVPSGAPWLDSTIGGSGFLGVSTDCTNPSCTFPAYIRFNSWRQAIIDLNNFYAGGAWFCANDACT